MPPSRNLADDAHARLRREIVTGNLLPGAHLSEGSACLRYGLTLAPVRAALVRLRAEGLLHSRPRAGHVVAPITIDDVLELFALRRVLQGHAAALAAGRAHIEPLRRLARICDAAVGQRRAYIQANAAFHRALVRAADSPRLSRMLDELLDHSERIQHLGLSARADRPLPAWRMPLLEQIEAGDSAAAQETMQRHIDNIRGMAVEALMANPALRNVQLQPARPSRIRSTKG